LREAIPLYGHRNWIVVADAAYPAQSRAGIETVVAGEDHLAVLREVLAAVAASQHVRPLVLTDRELAFVPEADAPGIAAYRRELDRILDARQRSELEHEQIISRLDQAAQTFRVLIIKTNMALPYTSVFLQLDCGYWGADAERRLRQSIEKSGGN
jgi:TorA maturation chaperone TorD